MSEAPKNVTVIIDPAKYSKEDVIRDIEEEGYNYNFFFANYAGDITQAKYAIQYASDEVWTWGDCSDQLFYIFAKDVGADLWNMRR